MTAIYQRKIFIGNMAQMSENLAEPAQSSSPDQVLMKSWPYDTAIMCWALKVGHHFSDPAIRSVP